MDSENSTGKTQKTNLSKTNRNLSIAADCMSGMSQREIAKKYGMSQPNVSLILKSDESVKHLIEQTTREMVSLLPKVMDTYRILLTSDDMALRLKACQDISRITGVAPSHTQSITINNVMKTSGVFADPEIMAALKQALAPAGGTIDLVDGDDDDEADS